MARLYNFQMRNYYLLPQVYATFEHKKLVEEQEHLFFTYFSNLENMEIHDLLQLQIPNYQMPVR